MSDIFFKMPARNSEESLLLHFCLDAGPYRMKIPFNRDPSSPIAIKSIIPCWNPETKEVGLIMLNENLTSDFYSIYMICKSQFFPPQIIAIDIERDDKGHLGMSGGSAHRSFHFKVKDAILSLSKNMESYKYDLVDEVYSNYQCVLDHFEKYCYIRKINL